MVRIGSHGTPKSRSRSEARGTIERWIPVELKLDTPATYRIRVKGYLDSSWSDRLSGLAISRSIQEDEQVVTTLFGQVADQAALAGVLSALYGLHLPILSVECLSDVETEEQTSKE
jgi:hypothetical protein